MKFTKIKKHKILETWQHKNREIGIVSYIYRIPNGGYHFRISCFKKRCGLDQCVKDDCDLYVCYNSLKYGFYYYNFEECRDAVIEWHRVWSE